MRPYSVQAIEFRFRCIQWDTPWCASLRRAVGFSIVYFPFWTSSVFSYCTVVLSYPRRSKPALDRPPSGRPRYPFERPRPRPRPRPWRDKTRFPGASKSMYCERSPAWFIQTVQYLLFSSSETMRPILLQPL
jgi:hypothetical protein